MAHNIDLTDPAVARLMGRDTGVVTPGAPVPKKMTTIAGDMDRGLTSTTRLDLGKREVAVIVRPKGSETMVTGVVVVDVYAFEGKEFRVELVCPRCHHQLTITAERKAIDWNPVAPCPFPSTIRAELEPEHHYLAAMPGVISIAKFGCTWELEDQMQDKGKDAHLILNTSRCRYRAVIDKNVLREV